MTQATGNLTEDDLLYIISALNKLIEFYEESHRAAIYGSPMAEALYILKGKINTLLSQEFCKGDNE